MALWKTLLLVGVVVLAWFFAHRYFDLVMLIAGILWVTEYFRSRQMGEGGERPVPVDDLARRLGIPVRTGQRSVKARWNDVLVQLSAVEVTAGTRRLTVYTFRKAPFCFVIRPRKAVIREADLVENSRIPGIKFEYQLRRVELPPPLEAAANLPDLFLDMAENADGARVDRWGDGGAAVQQTFFNGRAVHTHFVVEGNGGGPSPAALLDAHVAFHLNLLDLVDDVNFKVPM